MRAGHTSTSRAPIPSNALVPFFRALPNIAYLWKMTTNGSSKSRGASTSGNRNGYGNGSGPSRRPRTTTREAEKAQFSVSKNVAIHTAFEDMGLDSDVLRGLFSAGFDKPSAIQQRCIVPIIRGRDLIAQAQSGTGKTAMIAVVSLQLASTKSREVQVLIVSPTRELASQTHSNLTRLGEFTSVGCHACVGGKKISDDLRALEGKSVQVVSGTPGRVYDMIQRRVLGTKKLKTLVIDEADEMFGAGFKDQIYDIYRHIPADTQVILVSATLSREVLDMAAAFMSDPITVLVKRDGLSLKGIHQFHVDVETESWKFDTLCDLYETFTITQAVIFCNTKKKVEWLSVKMKENNFTVTRMHGDMVQSERDSVMQNFRSGKCRVLIASDVWARGIDVATVNLVINYDVPVKEESYLHRIGRSGRFGRTGVAVTFVTDEDKGKLRGIERHYGIKIGPMPADVDDLL